MLTARQFVVFGRVQGVGFRFFAEDAALREGLSGWVLNRPDGTVEVHAEGEKEAVERFERALGSGPPGARVQRIEVAEGQPEGRVTGFHIRG